MKQLHLLLGVGLMLGVTGCWTLHQSEYPQVEVSKAPADRDVRVQVSGFEATVTSYQAIYGYETVVYPWHPRRHGRRYYGGLASETYSTTTYVPQTVQTTAFVDRARVQLEDAGFLIGITNADYRVDVKFTGPLITDDDRTVQGLWILCSLLSADYAAQTWSATMRIYNPQTGRVLLRTDYSMKYSTAVWGPIPLFSPAGASETDGNYIQNWCLSALTDRAVADATAFMATQKK